MDHRRKREKAMAKMFDYVCSHCGSNDVLSDAYAEWNVAEQKWEIQNLFDKGAYCAKCDGETRLEKILLLKAGVLDEET